MCHTIEKLHLTGIKILNDVAGLSTRRARIKQLQQLPSLVKHGDKLAASHQIKQRGREREVTHLRRQVGNQVGQAPHRGTAGRSTNSHNRRGVLALIDLVGALWNQGLIAG